MDKIDQQLKNISFIVVPHGTHQSIMRKINYKRLQPMLLIVFSLLLLNLIVITWHINAKLVEAEFTDMISDFFEVLNFNFSFVKITLSSFFEIISLEIVLSAFLSFVGVIYVGRKISQNQFI